MARSAGPSHPAGLARRSRRAVHAAVIAAAALVLSTAISGAQGGGPPAPPDPAAKVEKKQVELDRKIQQAQDEAAKRQAQVDQQAAHLQEEAAKQQADIDRKAAKLQQETAKKQAKVDQKAAEVQQKAAAGVPAPHPEPKKQAPAAPQPTAAPAPAPAPAPTVSAPAASTPVPAAKHVAHEQAVLEHKRTEFAKHVAHDQAAVEHKRSELAKHVAHEQAKIEDRREKLAEHIADKQQELDRRRAEIARWLAAKIADLLNRGLGIHLSVGRPSAGRIPPSKFETAPPPKDAEKVKPETVVVAANQVAPVSPAPAGTPAPPPVIQPDGRIPKSGTGAAPQPAPAATPAPPAAATPSTPAAVTPSAASGAGPAGSKERSGGTSIDMADGVPIPHKHRSPGDVVIHPLARAVAEIPKTVWVGMSGLVALALALTLISVFQSRRALKLAATQRALREDMATLSSAVMPAVPTMLGGLALSVASRPAYGPASGGDFHDAFELTDGRTAVIVGDVAGHGSEAVAATVLVRHTLRAYLEAGLEPRAALATTGAVLADRHAGLLATAVVAVHDRYRETLTLASAGHVPPIVLGGASRPPVAAAWPPPLGAGVPTGQRQTTMPLPPGTTVALFTDGASEARLGEGRVGSAELANWMEDLGPEASAEEMLAYVQKRSDGVDDDATICVLRSTGEDGAAPADVVEELAVSPGEGPTLIRFLIACGVSPSRAAELAVNLQQASERATMVAEVRIGENGSQAQLRPAKPLVPPAFAAA